MSARSPADAQDWEQVNYVMMLALHIMEGKEEMYDFVELLVGLLKSRLLWDETDPCTLAAVAVYADRFPMIVNEKGEVFWAEPEDALDFSTDPVFTEDPFLVALAERRAARPDRQRALDGEPYLDHGV